jgi:thiol-disulfide isomerase/thioredoxin
VERTLLPVLSDAYAEQITKAMSTTLHAHPYYISLRNSMLSSILKVGNEAPNITLPLLSGETKQLSDYRGKYVILNFWNSACEKSAEMLAEMKNVYEVVKANADQFIILSIALDNDLATWREAVSNNDIDREGWLHACEGVGETSLAAKLFKVEAAPKVLLIEPEGRAVSLNMELDEIVMRLEQILMGDLYYLDQKE